MPPRPPYPRSVPLGGGSRPDRLRPATAPSSLLPGRVWEGTPQRVRHVRTGRMGSGYNQPTFCVPLCARWGPSKQHDIGENAFWSALG